MGQGIIFSFVGTAIILTASFFVLVTARKIDAPWLKVFGYGVAGLLWICAALVLGRALKGVGCSNCSTMDRPGYHMTGGRVVCPKMHGMRGADPAMKAEDPRAMPMMQDAPLAPAPHEAEEGK
jgi:hypothetical protein